MGPWSAARRWIVVVPVLLVTGVLALSGCDLSADDDDYDHRPPSGMGSLIIDNHTDDDISVYVDGVETNKAPEDDWKAYDLSPGQYRIVLEQRGGDHSFSGDIDVLEGRQTILDVEYAFGDPYRYDVFIRYD